MTLSKNQFLLLPKSDANKYESIMWEIETLEIKLIGLNNEHSVKIL